MRSILSLAAMAAVASSFTAATKVKPIVHGKWTFYTLPTEFSGPCDLATGHDGNIWVQDLLVDKLVELNYHTNKISQYNIPYTIDPSPVGVLPGTMNRTALACVIRRGRDGLLYYAAGVRNQIGTINEQTKKTHVYTDPNYNPGGNLFFFNDMWKGKNGMFFTMTTGNEIVLLDYKTRKFQDVQTSFPITGGPLGLRQGPDGRMWGTEVFAQRLFALNQTTFELEEFDIPTTMLTDLAFPAVMRVTTGGRYMWFCAFAGGSLGRFDIYTHEFKAYPAPAPASFPTEDALDGDGNIWFSSADFGSFFRFNPKTETYKEFVIPTKALPGGFTPDTSLPIAIHYNPGDNKMYFTLAGSSNQIGSLALD